LRRAILALGGTVAGIAALLAVKFQPADSSTTAAGAQAASQSTGSQSAPATPTGTATASGTPRGGSSAGGTGGTAQSATASTFTGTVDNTSYGPMQVEISVSGKKITKVTVLQQTNTGSESQSIDAMAIPKLTTEALTAQNASIDAVSGASYTSAGYKQSLQSAIDKAGL
jgi:uncharacterized protein with FMN-binding domain